MFKTTKSLGQNYQMIILIKKFYTQLLLTCCSTHKAEVGIRSKQKCKTVFPVWEAGDVVPSVPAISKGRAQAVRRCTESAK